MPQVIIIKKDNRPYYVGLLSDIKPQEYLKLVKECDDRFLKEQNERDILLQKLENCERKIKELEGRLLLDEGKITKEEYERWTK